MWATARLNTPSCTVVLEFLEVYNGAFFSIKRSGECRRGRGDMRHGARGKREMQGVGRASTHSSLALSARANSPSRLFYSGEYIDRLGASSMVTHKNCTPTAHKDKQVTTGLHEAGPAAGGEVRATAGRHPAPRGLSTPCAGRCLSHAPRG